MPPKSPGFPTLYWIILPPPCLPIVTCSVIYLSVHAPVPLSRDLTAPLLTVAPNEDLLCAQHVLQG